MNAKFDLGEKTGLKADPNQVSADMRNARDEENNRRFCREEWLTKNQIKSFFSRLASAKRKGEDDVDDRAELDDILGEQEENSMQLLINSIILISLVFAIQLIVTTFTTFGRTVRAANCQNLMLSC